MNIHLMHGEFSSNDTTEIIAQMVHLMIKYHENKINIHSNEEDIYKGEAKIKQMQKELYELRKTIHSKTSVVKVEAIIKIE